MATNTNEASAALQTAGHFRDIEQLLTLCIFPGCYAKRVADAIAWLSLSAAAMEQAGGKIEKADAKRKKKALKLAKPVKEAASDGAAKTATEET